MRLSPVLRRSRLVFRAAILVALAAALFSNMGDRVAAQTAAMRWDGLIEHITAPSQWGDQQPNGPSQLQRHSVSADGRYVVFTSDATNLPGGWGPAIFIRDRHAGETRLLLGIPGRHFALSADGNHLAFEVCDPWMRPDYAAICDIWTLDLRTWSMQAVSALPDGTLGSGDSTQPVLSADGRFVAFRTNAANLLRPGAAPGQVVVRDRDADGNGVFDEPGTVTLDVASAANASADTGNDVSESAELSDDGRYVAFRSRASNLVTGDTNNAWDVFVRDRATQETRRVNIRPQGQQSPFSIDSAAISISADGRYVAFASADPLLAAGYPDDTDAALDVFVYDRDASSLTRLDLTSDGLGGTYDVESPMLSADGRYVAVMAWSRNDSYPPAPLSHLVHVYDRATATSTLVSVRPDGITPDDQCEAPAIAADGSTVLFTSRATNLAVGVTARIDAIWAAVYFDVQPAEVTVPGRGGSATFTVTAQAHTRWSPTWDWSSCCWFVIDSYPEGVGNGTISFRAQQPNDAPTPRSMNITFNGAKTVVFKQLEGLSLASVSPASGPATGGTVVTVRGTGFEPDTRVWFGGADAATQFVDSTTIIATTPPGQVGSTWVAVVSSDYRSGWLDAAFRYLDTTPPQIWWGVSGTLGNDGWYTDNATVQWAWWDQDSAIQSTSGCDPTVLATDTPGTTLTCSVTSEGGTATASATVKRDATPPTVTITSPGLQPIYDRESVVPAEYTCTDALSGSQTCGGDVPAGQPIDTSYSGSHWFNAWGSDKAGNLGWSSVEYIVSNGYCTMPNPGLKAWWRMQGNTNEQLTGSPALRVGFPQDAFAPAITGQGYSFPPRNSGRLDHYHYSTLDFSTAMTFAAWIKPTTSGWGILARHPFQYRFQRYGDGAIGFQFAQQDGGVAQATTTAKAPQNVWTHVAVTYDNGLVKTYVNGQLVDTYTRAGTLRVPAWQTPLSIGGQDDPGNPMPFVGGLDELQLFDRALTDSEVAGIFLSGGSGLCVPEATTLEVASPIYTSYGAGIYHVSATLRDSQGYGMGNQPVTLHQGAYDQVGDPTPSVTLVTDMSGTVRWDAPFDLAMGTYPGALTAHFAGDFGYAKSHASADVIVQKGVVWFNWTPAPLSYGMPLSYAGQLNATANVPGTFSYNPPAGTILDAGFNPLDAMFHPIDTTNYNDTPVSVSVFVNQAVPNVSVTGGTFTFDAQPHAAAATATDYRGAPLTPLSVTYNGSPAVPVNAGSYDVVASYAGNANYLARSVTATLTIQKAAPSIVLSTPATFTYDGQAHGVSASVYDVGGALLGSATIAYTGLSGPPVDAGTYTATATFAGDANYGPRTASATITINPAAPTVSVSGGSYVYDKQPHAATATATGIGGEALGPITITYDNRPDAPVNAGTFAVVAAFAGAQNYAAASASGSLTIAKAAPIVTVPDATFTYGDASPHLLAAVATGVGGEVLSTSLPTVYNGQPGLIPSDAGTYSAVATYAGSANYTSATGSGTLTILKAAPVFSVSGGTIIYDAQPHPAVVILSGVHGETLSSYTVSYNGTMTVPVDAGSYAVEASFPGSANYAAATATNTITIHQATPAVSATDGTYTYDAQPHAAVVTATDLAGHPLAVTVTYNGASAVPVNAGAYAVQATYAGSVNYAAASATATVTINRAIPTVSVTGGTFTYDGQPHPATATVTGVGGESLTPVTIQYWRDGFGYFDVPIGAGTYQANAFFNGSTNYTSRSASGVIVVGKATPSVTWAAPAPIVYGTALTAAQLNASANVGGSFSYSPNFSTVLPAGSGRALSATFFPTDAANYTSVGVSTMIDVARAPLTVKTADTFKPFGAPLPAFTATGSGFVNGDSMASLAGTLSFSTAATAASPVGTYPVTPAGLSSANYSIAFAAGTLTIAQANTNVSVTPSANPSGLNQAVTFTAAVSVVAPGAGSPTGSVEFRDGATLLGTVTLTNGSASLSTNGFSAGAHTISAIYSGDASFSGAGGSIAQTVKTAAASSTTAVSSSANPSTTGNNVTLTATVTAPAGVSGTVEFYDAATLIGSSPLVGTSATLTTSALTEGSHAITARYLGNASIPPSVSSVFVQGVAPAGAHLRTGTIALTASPSPSTLGGSVTFTATVTGVNKLLPTGSVLFLVNGQVIGSAAGVAIGPTGTVTARATFSTSALAHGTHTVTAVYLGDSTYRGVATNVSLTVN